MNKSIPTVLFTALKTSGKMNYFLRKLKLVGDLHTELEIQKSEFVNKLSKIVDEDTGTFPNPFEAFSSNKKEYKGKVGFESFKIKRNRKLFDTNFGSAVAKGTYSQKEDLLIIDTEINAFRGMMIPFYIMLVIIYGITITSFLAADNVEGDGFGFALPFIIIHGTLMMAFPYFMMRRSKERFKYELEREFYYLTKK